MHQRQRPHPHRLRLVPMMTMYSSRRLMLGKLPLYLYIRGRETHRQSVYRSLCLDSPSHGQTALLPLADMACFVPVFVLTFCFALFCVLPRPILVCTHWIVTSDTREPPYFVSMGLLDT